MRSIPLARPTLGLEEERAVSEVLRSGWISQGPKVEEFEERLAERLGVSHVCAVNSGTSAIMLALRAFGIGPGTSVVVPAFGCAATAMPVLETGGSIRFADLEPAGYNLNWDSIARALEPNTRAVLIAHMFGQIAQIDQIAKECDKRGLLLIEDAALGFGASKKQKCAGTFGLAGCFSFHPRKLVTTGEGGAVCTNDSRAAAEMRADRSYGAAQSAWSRFQTGDGSPRGFSRLAYNLKLTDIQAAVGLVQLTRMPSLIARRREIARAYDTVLRRSDWIQLFPPPETEEEHVYQSYICFWKPSGVSDFPPNSSELRHVEDSLIRFKERVRAAGIGLSDAGQFLPELPVFNQPASVERCPHAYRASRLAFALPIFPLMSDQDVEAVLQAVEGAVWESQRESA